MWGEGTSARVFDANFHAQCRLWPPYISEVRRLEFLDFWDVFPRFLYSVLLYQPLEIGVQLIMGLTGQDIPQRDELFMRV